MRIGFDIDMKDVEAFYKHYIDTNKAIKRMKRILLSVFAVLLIYTLFDTTLPNSFDEIDGFYLFLLLIPALIPIIGIIYVLKFFSKRILRRMKKELSNPINTNIFGFREMILDDEGLKINGKESSSSMKWSAIKQLDETPEYFFLYIASSMAHVIPKKKISISEVEELDVLLKKYFTEINVFKK